MNEVRIDPENRIARVGAGVLWGDLAEAAGAHGLAALHPSSPDVGVVGYSIGGGIGWYARRLGLQCNAVTAVELVLADGTFVRATAESEPDLFWALRGGGTPLGVVCALGVPAPSARDRRRRASSPGTGPRSRTCFPAGSPWCAEAPGRGDVVVPAARRPRLRLDACRRSAVADWRSSTAPCSGDDAFGRRRAGARCERSLPEIDTMAGFRPPRWSGCTSTPRGPTPAYASSTLVSAACPTRPSPRSSRRPGRSSGTRLAMAELRQLGGALSRPDPERRDPVLARRGLPRARCRAWSPTRRGWPQQREDAARFLAAVEPWATGREYLPMLDESSDTRKAFPPTSTPGCPRSAARCDPHGLFMAPHPSPQRGHRRHLSRRLKFVSTVRQGLRGTVCLASTSMPDRTRRPP